MVQVDRSLSTGLRGLDTVLRGLMPGDSVVWQIKDIEDYIAFVTPYCSHAIADGKRLIYFRFARHMQVVEAQPGLEICELDPEAGFESFLGKIHNRMEEAGLGAYYVFDCLSDLSADWYSDQMIGNFFMLTSPYLFDLEAISYFALFRNTHSLYAAEPILSTTQVFLEVYRYDGALFVQPLKVLQRYSPTIHVLHKRQGDDFYPVRESYITAEVLGSEPHLGLDSVHRQLGIWARTVLEADSVLERRRHGGNVASEMNVLINKMLRMAISRDERVLALAEKYLSLEDILFVIRRMVGTGLIGGKSVGMLLARGIVQKNLPEWRDRLEIHDSFYIASDVFYTFLVRNGCWWIRQKLRDPEHFLEDADSARRRIFTGTFPTRIEDQFERVLDYFGQSPIIVRSSSLLEDNFGNAFAGKYESVFCANHGSRHQRLEEFIAAVKTVYASAMSKEALSYRERRGMLDRNEQMALLVQRVSGSNNGPFFFPQTAGVALSFNPYVWNQDIDPAAGLLRLVFGLGTRAVDRSDDDYTRLVALNAPNRRPEGSMEHSRQYMQRKVDVLDLEGNTLDSRDFSEVEKVCSDLPMGLFASRDSRMAREARARGERGAVPLMLTFDRLLSKTDFVDRMREMLATVQAAYDCPVDIEFTANFVDEDNYRVNIVQCRPFQVKGSTSIVPPPTNLSEQDVILRTEGPVIGQSRVEEIDRIVYVSPTFYGQLPIKERHAIARLLGEALRVNGDLKREHILLMGPGRWGTSSPELGVPVSFAEICKVSIVCEIVAMRENLVPDVSMGTHFFSELVEMDMVYMALFPSQEGNALNTDFLEKTRSIFPDLLPHATKYGDIIRVIDKEDFGGRVLRLHADTLKQNVVCCFSP